MWKKALKIVTLGLYRGGGDDSFSSAVAPGDNTRSPRATELQGEYRDCKNLAKDRLKIAIGAVALATAFAVGAAFAGPVGVGLVAFLGYGAAVYGGVGIFASGSAVKNSFKARKAAKTYGEEGLERENGNIRGERPVVRRDAYEIKRSPEAPTLEDDGQGVSGGFDYITAVGEGVVDERAEMEGRKQRRMDGDPRAVVSPSSDMVVHPLSPDSSTQGRS